MARFSSQSGGGNPELGLIKSINWNYPSVNGVAIQAMVNGTSIAVKSSQSAALRWHIRDGGQSVGNGGYDLEALSINQQNGEYNVGPYQVEFAISPLDFVPPINYYYSVFSDGGPWDGNYLAIASTATTLTLEYPGPTLPGANEDFTGATIGVPSVYNQVEATDDGVWIKNANWSAGQGSYSNYWNFKTNGSINFPNLPSNARTGYGEVLQFGNNTAQTIITGPSTDDTHVTATRLVVAGQDGYTGSTGEGGDVYLWAGTGGNAGGSGGDIKVDGGNAYGASEGGTIKVRGGYSPSGTGGFVLIEGGAGGNIGGRVDVTTFNNAPITLSGAGGEFLNDSSNANNQIATVGDIANVGGMVRYSPTFDATGLTFTGADTTYPTYNSYYTKVGKLVTFVIEVDCTTVTNFGTGQYKLQLPFTPAVGFNHFSGWAWADPDVSPDTGTGHTIINADTAGVTDVLDLHYLKSAGGANAPIREGLFLQGTPVTLTTISKIYINGTYISAT